MNSEAAYAAPAIMPRPAGFFRLVANDRLQLQAAFWAVLLLPIVAL
jgi:hypothetical protein